ncbi:MAG TPA: LytTR family DNA-binding domain-containing protein [Prolixibacteraceae bacterium]|nr:LytTR family DNA-binding domain-containing protein [Prolixibacteraceae bacterium]
MKVIILEDENRAASLLERLLANVAPHMMVVAKLESIRDGVIYLRNNPEPDLIFSDIQLADGLSFEIYNQVAVRCPIIFTTAYDHYAIEAFKTNGIDYLLKPIEEERLTQAIGKAKHFSPGLVLEKILSVTNQASAKSYKSRFMVKVGDKIKSIPVEEIMVFYSQKASFILTADKHTYCIDYTLDQLEPMLDPETYFRINRKYIVSINACTHILAWSNSRLRLKIDGTDDPDIIVARERVQEFKNWLDR